MLLKITLVLIFLFITPAFATKCIGSISASVISSVALSEGPDGSVTASGDEPLYCDTDSQGNVMCYY